MPRILPRLLKCLAESKQLPEPQSILPGIATRKTRKHTHKPSLTYEHVHANDRAHSILLDTVNPIINRKDFIRYKSPPPKPVLPNVNSMKPLVEHTTRKMTDQELHWWSSPYLRMLSSKIRQCSLSSRYLPSDFLIRFGPKQLPITRMSPSPAQSLFPDGLEHHKYKQQKIGYGTYMICWKRALEAKLNQKNILRRSARNLTTHPLLIKQIGHLLRLRVLQELEILAKSAKRTLKTEYSPSIRRLTRGEWKAFKSSGLIPYPNAVALLVVPPLNKDLVTKKRPTPHTSATPETLEPPIPSTEQRPLPAISTLHSTMMIEETEDMSLPDMISDPSIPMYNGISLFPSRSQRAALHERLCSVLRGEKYSRFFQTNLALRSENEAKEDRKSSHAFLIFSDASTVQRADTVPLAIALWRVKLWEGDGWEQSSRWEITP